MTAPHGYLIVDKESGELDWDGEVHPTVAAAIESLCEHGSFRRTVEDTTGEDLTYWAEVYAIHPVGPALDPDLAGAPVDQEGHGLVHAVAESAEAVEAAARALDPHTMGSAGPLAEKFKDRTRAEARRALEAASPRIKRAALLEAADAMPIETLQGADKASVWLRARAHSFDQEGHALVKAIRDRKDQEPRKACAVRIWDDGVYPTTCGYTIIGGRCIRHGADGPTYDIPRKDQPSA